MSVKTLNEAMEMIDNKKGVGVSKKTIVRINLEFKGSITLTRSSLGIINAVLTALRYQGGLKDDAVQVETEFENNPDWES